MTRILLWAMLALLAWTAPGSAMTLITADEARLPDPPVMEDQVRGLSAMTGFTQVLPAKQATARSPFQFQVRFLQPCDPASVSLTVVKQPAVDLTARITPYVTAQGINIPDAQVPPGEYKLRLFYRDASGNQKAGLILFSVAP